MGYEVEFLSVGSGDRAGDAIVLRFGNLVSTPVRQTVVVIDAGYAKDGERVVEHINNWYDTNTVDLVVSTHPDGDHTGGMATVLEEMDVKLFWLHRPWNHAKGSSKWYGDGHVTEGHLKQVLKEGVESAKTLEGIALRRGIPIVEPFAGTKDPTGQLIVCGPSVEEYEFLLTQFECTPEPKISLASFLESVKKAAKEVYYTVAEEWGHDGLDDNPPSPSAVNGTSTVILFGSDGKYFLFTGDATILTLSAAVDRLVKAGFDLNQLTVVQVPHHGSRRNVGPTLLNQLLGPKQASQGEPVRRHAFVSAAKDGGPKHPSRRVMNAFLRRGTPVTWATGGGTIRFDFQAPDRGWSPVPAQPFFPIVEEIQDPQGV